MSGGLTIAEVEALYLRDRILRVPTILDHGSPNPALTLEEAAQCGRDYIRLHEIRLGAWRP